jgi:hypothetical protein
MRLCAIPVPDDSLIYPSSDRFKIQGEMLASAGIFEICAARFAVL